MDMVFCGKKFCGRINSGVDVSAVYMWLQFIGRISNSSHFFSLPPIPLSGPVTTLPPSLSLLVLSHSPPSPFLSSPYLPSPTSIFLPPSLSHAGG